MAKSRVLLPNLLTLRVVGAEEEDQLRHYFELLKQLISPSLRALKIYKFASWDLRQFSGVLIRKAVSKCPRLNLLWMTSPIPLTGGPLPVPLYVEDLTIHPHNVTLAVLEWIAAIPCLKTLQIGGRRSIVTRPWELDACPPSAYASLRSLTVTFLGTQSATYFWSLTLVKNLSFVRIMFRRFHSTAIPNALEFFSLLAKRSPNLTGLSLVFMHASWESSIFLFPTRLLSHLSPISLDFLEINGAQLNAEGANAFSQIAQLWPSLCTLNLRNHPATLSDLAIISASFSRLSHLSLTLAAELPPGKDNSTPPIQHFGQPLTFQTPFVFISALSVPEKDDFALYLARLWKNARCVHPRKNKAYAKFLNRLNARILDYSRVIVE
ncbi:hypothetical protein BDV93DRAFT_514500 [Ceratobasidium sp. AG-I]|nr:hypothetical protein BDV93DRAFT_514500 [Ceratobasidium sp. AG-I]